MTSFDTQRRVQALIDEGKNDREIADRLLITPSTVRDIRNTVTVDPLPAEPVTQAKAASSLSERVLTLHGNGTTIPRIARDLRVTEQYAREVIRAAQADKRATAPAQRPAPQPIKDKPVMCLRDHLDEHTCPEPELVEVEVPKVVEVATVCTLRHTERVRTVVGPCHRPHATVCLRRHDPKPAVETRVIPCEHGSLEQMLDAMLAQADQHPDGQVRALAVGARSALDLMAQRLDEYDDEQIRRQRDEQAAALRAELEEHQREIDRIHRELSALHPEEETSARAVEARERRAAAAEPTPEPTPAPAGFEVGPGPSNGHRQISPEGRERMRLAGIETARKRRAKKEQEQANAGTATSGSAAG
jgi:hypothetical protein